jgi:hypothetical protein
MDWKPYRLFGLAILLGLFIPVALGWSSPASGEERDTSDPLVEHLEFLGYECEILDKGIRATHHSKLHLVLTYFQGGIRMQTGYPGKDPTLDMGEGRFEVLNGVNQKTKAIHFYWSEKGHLFGTAWMPGTYDRSRFAALLEAWENDSKILRQAYDRLKPYLKESTPSPDSGT